RRIGVQESRVTVTADPAFALDHPRPERQATGPRPVVGLAVRPWPGVDVAELATATVAALAGKGYGVELLPMQRTQDEALASEIAGRAGGAASIAAVAGAFRAALDASSSLACVAAMRLHALAFGAVSGTPLVGIAYDPKVTALMDTLGQGRYSVGLRDADPDRIVEFVEAAVADAPSVRTHLSIRVGWLREAALANVDRVCELVGRGVGARAVAR
ncbi:MAG: hypothetical protein FJX72_09120, partial [Armatimonadetes bacterium]|nr:hypothetical protein [Armatimonadota bacterium]